MDKRFKWPFNQKRNNYLDQPPPHARGYHPLYNKSYSRLQNYPNYKFSNHNASGGGNKVYYNQQPPPPSIYAREASGGGGGGGWLAPAPPVADSGYSSNNNSSSSTNSSSDVVTMIVENNNLKKMIVLHLNLMQEQTDSLTAKDKELYEQNGRIKTLLSQNQELIQQIDKLGQRIEDLRSQLRRRAERDDVEVPKAKVHCYADKETQTIDLAPPLQKEIKEQEQIKSHFHGYPQKSIKQSQNVHVLVTSVTDLPPTTPILDPSKERDKFNCGKKVSTIFLHRVHQEKTKFQPPDEVEDQQQQQQEEEQREEMLEEDVEEDEMQINMEDEEHIYNALETHEMEVVTETIIGAEEELGAEEETVNDVDPVNNGHIYEDEEEESEEEEDEDDDEEEEEDDEEDEEDEDDGKEELHQDEDEDQQQLEEEKHQQQEETEDLTVEQEIITNNLWQPNDEPHEEIVEEETEKDDQEQGQLYVTDVDSQSLDTPFAHSTPQLQQKIFNETFNESKNKKPKSTMQKWREEQEQQKLIEKACLQLRKEHKGESIMKDSEVQTVEIMHTEVQTEDVVQMEEIEMETEVELTPTKVHKKHKDTKITRTPMSAKSIVTTTKTTVQKMPVVANHHQQQASTTTKLRPNEQHVVNAKEKRVGAKVKIAGKVKDLSVKAKPRALGKEELELRPQKHNSELQKILRTDAERQAYEEWMTRGGEEILERELQRESDEMREKELELERELQWEEELRLEREQKKEREKEQEREQQKAREREQQKEREQEKQKEREREKQKEREREQQKEKEREQQIEKELEQQKEKEREQQKEREREQQKVKEQEQQKEREREQQKEREREKQKQQEREQQKEQEREQQKQRELEQKKEREQELQKSQEREQQAAAAKAKEDEENKEREQQKERERKQREQRKRDKESAELEQSKQKPKKEEKEPQTDQKQEEVKEEEKLPKEEETDIEEEAMRKLHEHLQRQQQRLQNQPQQQLPFVRLKKSPMQTSLIYPPIAPTTTTAASTQLTPAPTPSPTNVASAAASSPKPKMVNNNNNNNFNNSKTLVDALIQNVDKTSPESKNKFVKNNSSSSRISTSASGSAVTSEKRLSRFRTSVQLYTTRSWEDQEFHCDNEFFLEEADELLADNPSLEIPKWKVVNIRRSPDAKGTEALSDADFERRHEKDVRDEIERKKRDARYLREQQRSDTLRMRHNQDEVLVPLDPLPTSTFYPLPMDIEGIEFVTEVPVQAFGENVVNLPVQNDDFTLPWLEAATATTDTAKAKAEAVPVATLASKKIPTSAAEARHQEMNSSYVFLKRRKRQRRR